VLAKNLISELCEKKVISLSGGVHSLTVIRL
jgi:hypothetical protein